MLNILQEIVNYVGMGNIISIVTFIIGILISYYLYFRSFYRLIYVSETICKTCETYLDWYNGENELNTRIIIYNNGRKTISKNQILNLEVTANNLKQVFTIKSVENFSTTISDNICKIEIEHLDSSDYIVIELVHEGQIKFDGRVAETGKLLYRETRTWIVINAIVIIPMTVALFYNALAFIEKQDIEFVAGLIYFASMFGIIAVLRYIHGLLFIPDNVTAKYIHSEDKWNRKFKNQF